MKREFLLLLLIFIWSNVKSEEVANDPEKCSLGKFKLVTILYNEKNPERMQEYITCLERNLAHESIDTIHVIYDTSKDDKTNKLLNILLSKEVRISYVRGRPTYGYCFDLASEEYPSARIILTNADIYFNETLQKLESYDLADTFLALTRWNVQKGNQLIQFYAGRKKKEDSQDAWIFQVPLKKFENENIVFGEVYSDSQIACRAFRSGLKVLNPCLAIQSCHLHTSRIRHWKDRPHPKGMSAVPWCRLDS